MRILSVFFTISIFMQASDAALPADDVTYDQGQYYLGTVLLTLNAGYAVPVGGSRYIGSINGSSRWIDSNGMLVKVKDHYLNAGEGIKAEISGSFWITPGLTIESSVFFTGKQPRTSITYDSASASWDETWKQVSYGLKIMLVPKIKVFNRFEMDVGFGAGLIFTSITFVNSSEMLGINTGYVKTQPGFLTAGRIGVEYPVLKHTSIVASIAAEQSSFKVLEWRQTTSDRITETSPERGNLSGDKQPQEKIPASNIAFLIGVRFRI